MTDVHKLFVIGLIILTWIIQNILTLASVGNHRLTYTGADLLQLWSSVLCQQKPPVALPPEIKPIKPRRRGRRGGVRTRLRRRPFRPPLPSIILANVRSLRNKIDLLHAKCTMERGYRDACLITLTETWLDEEVPES